MTNLNLFAGIDISKATFDVCLRSCNSEQVKQFSYDAKGMKELGKWLPKDTHCIMEASGPYYLKLAFWLQASGCMVSVVNPLIIKRFGQMRMIRAKTDKVDARLIAAYGEVERPPLWQPPAEYLLKLQQLQALHQQLQKHHKALMGQVEAFSALGPMDKEVAKFLKSSLNHLDKQMKGVTATIDRIISQYYKELLQNITTIPGLGKKTAAALIIITNGFKKFSNHKQVAAYMGLSPRIYQSGTSLKGRGHICKMGMSRIRSMLYVCSWSAITCNEACKQLYQRLLANGKAKKVALIAVTNKLLKQAFAIATKNQQYVCPSTKNICF